MKPEFDEILTEIERLEKEINILNDTTVAAIEEGRRLAYDKSVKGYTSMDELKAATLC